MIYSQLQNVQKKLTDKGMWVRSPLFIQLCTEHILIFEEVRSDLFAVRDGQQGAVLLKHIVDKFEAKADLLMGIFQET